jgi:hypothetical protein
MTTLAPAASGRAAPSAAAPSLQVVYCLAATTESAYVHYLLVSAATVRSFHPDLPITILVDAARTQWCEQQADNLRALQVDVLPVALPPLPARAAGRMLKTLHRQTMHGRCLYLDADAMLVRPLPPFPDAVKTVGVVPDRNHRYPAPMIPFAWHIWRRSLHWGDLAPGAYCNAGVILSTPASRPVFERWQQEWERFRQKETDHDQPSFNAATAHDPSFRLLPPVWNAMVEVQPWFAGRASVVHYFTAGGQVSRNTEMAHLAALLEQHRSVESPAFLRRLAEHRVWCHPPPLLQWLKGLPPFPAMRSWLSWAIDQRRAADTRHRSRLRQPGSRSRNKWPAPPRFRRP